MPFPLDVPVGFPCGRVEFFPDHAARSGGPSLTGGEQFVETPGGRWIAQQEVYIRTADQVMAWRGFLARLRGQAGTVRLGPSGQGARAPWPLDPQGVPVTPKRVRHPELDGTTYADPANRVDNLIAATLASSALLNAVTLGVTRANVTLPVEQVGAPARVGTPALLRVGQYLGLGGRLYLIDEIVVDNGLFANVRVWPWLRADAASGAAVNFTGPTTTMRLASGDQMRQGVRVGARLTYEWTEDFS